MGFKRTILILNEIVDLQNGLYSFGMCGGLFLNS